MVTHLQAIVHALLELLIPFERGSAEQYIMQEFCSPLQASPSKHKQPPSGLISLVKWDTLEQVGEQVKMKKSQADKGPHSQTKSSNKFKQPNNFFIFDVFQR